ncbi:MAG TPA: 16S rRNA (cytosine(1402)-N(4))-methyltransferase RsmH [Candidatus Magasanikbacteria bacterium]|jgi:16S rRNA (cytosine1402-N4)-methyltransferase|nr:16S rRNA (cytosine(1402)-N(4))-methyltransferase RsmH [Candidatus Magasanikbacteria bacterium]HQF56963.1 16S rRNA (cytosine(1402)-N(4))-methyltransferase RsmH [Candidatus Magasanikbacteria bacterium]
MRHVPVLLNEVIDNLNLKSGSYVIDCTLGDAGHSEKILEKIGQEGRLLGIDADPEAILRARQYLERFSSQIILVRANFVNLKKIVEENSFVPEAILIDLGWSTPQFNERGRGFSFLHPDENLDMRYSEEVISTAADVLNTRTEKELSNIFKDYGEEKFSNLIAEKIIEKRKQGKNFAIVSDLVETILEVYRKKLKTNKEVPWIGGLHPATKVFQALRIEVNNELGILETTLPQAIEVLQSGGRLAVITFHSLEDRIVKHYFKKQNNKNIKIINKKPIVCGEEESKNNPPSRSAKLRIIEKI